MLEQGVPVEMPVVIAKKHRGKGKSASAKSAPQTTIATWLRKNKTYTAKDCNSNIPLAFAKRESGLAFDAKEKRLYCSICTSKERVYVVDDTFQHLAQHFGFKKERAIATHVAAMDARHAQPPLPFVVDGLAAAAKAAADDLTLKEKQREFEIELVEVAARSGIASGQLAEFFPLLKKYVSGGVAQELPVLGRSLLRKRLRDAAEGVERRTLEERKGYQLHLAGDAAQDKRGRSVFMTTAEFGGGKSQLISVDYPSESLNHKTLGALNARIIGGVGGSPRVDSYALDSVSYNLKWSGAWAKLLDGTFTVILPDACHRIDGVLDAVIGNVPVLEVLISCCNNVFKSTNRAWTKGFEEAVKESGYAPRKYISPGMTRAWTGSYRVLEWLFEFLNPLAEYVRKLFPSTKDPSKKLVELNQLFKDNHLHDIKVTF